MTDRHLHLVPVDAPRPVGPSYGALELEHDTADTPCPYCEAPAGERCRNLRTGDEMRVPHWQRVKASSDDT